MSASGLVHIATPALLEFRGPDAVRFLNGQITQDVRRVAGGKISLPSCITDAKGRLQFRVWISESPDRHLWVEGPFGIAEALETRLTRYLIADDVEVHDNTGKFQLIHLIGETPAPPEGVIARVSRRFNTDGTDWWFPAGHDIQAPPQAHHLHGDELESLRIANGVPLWGRELKEGTLPPEAGLDATDISYQKGCYIGQEVISRIKSAGKVNKRLVRLELAASCATDDLRLLDENGAVAGEITSISPHSENETHIALAYIKRGVGRVYHAGRLCLTMPQYPTLTGDGAARKFPASE
jgi:tRNA-modifying protein YgfZ